MAGADGAIAGPGFLQALNVLRAEQTFADKKRGTEEAMAYLEERLRRMGVLRALESEGFQPGDEIEIGGVSFELDPGRQ